VRRGITAGLLTRDQTEALQQPNAIDTLYSKMKQRINDTYASYADHSIKFDDGTSPIGSLNLNWYLDKPPVGRDGLVADFPTTALELLKNLLTEFSAKDNKLNKSQIAFKVAQALSKANHVPSATGAGEVFVPQMFLPNSSGRINSSMDQLATLMASVAAHEIGHRVALPHTTSYPESATLASEVQHFSVVPSATSFSLNYAGAPTGQILAGAPANVVEAALAALPGLTPSLVRVSGPIGGPYTISFANPPYASNDVPQITGVNINLGSMTDGKSNTPPARTEVLGSSVSGWNDLMRPTTSALIPGCWSG
jgi:hypothetical protein